jgi:hypothetical protein
MGRLLHFLENCFLTVILAFGIFPIALASAVCLAMVFHLKLASTMLICLTTICALIWLLYFCVQHELLLPWPWLRRHFGSYSLIIARNSWRSFRLAYTRIVQSIRPFKRTLAPRLTVVRRKRFVPAVVLLSVLVIFGSIWIGIRVSRAVFGDISAKERTQRNVNANKSTPNARTPRDNRNKNKSKSGKQTKSKK